MAALFHKVYKNAFTTGTGPPPTDNLTPPTRDAIFQHQMATANPMALTPESLYVAKICETHQYATSVFHSLQKVGCITASPACLPDTTKVDSSLVSKIAIISVPKVRETVNMLFWWEEECTRLRLLADEEAELEGLIRERAAEGQDVSELQMALKVVGAKRGVLPSERLSDGRLVGQESEDQVPAYEEVSGAGR